MTPEQHLIAGSPNTCEKAIAAVESKNIGPPSPGVARHQNLANPVHFDEQPGGGLILSQIDETL